MARLGDYANIKTGKLDANASSDSGIYPFFTCSKEPLKIETYSYDCECVLVAGNGDLNVKYYFGKFDAYQRTYIIESKNKEKLSVRFLFYFLDKYVDTLREQSIGGVIKYIKLGNLTEAIIPLPPLEEQRKIAAVLDKVNDLIAKRCEQLDKLDLLVKSQFIEMFGDPATSQKYERIPIGELTTVTSGGTPSRKTERYWKGGNIPWVKTTELQNTTISDTEEHITEAGMAESSAKYVPPETILIAMYGQGKTRGMTALLEKEATTNQACACILPSKNIDQRYLWKFMMHSYENLRSLAEGAGQPNLNAKMIKDFPVIIPPRDMQTEYVKFTEQADKSKSTIQKSLEKLEILKKSLMQQYFG